MPERDGIDFIFRKVIVKQQPSIIKYVHHILSI